MPCRKGCSTPTPGPVCCCARCCSRHRPQMGEFCTANTCSNPGFCIAYRPQFCPNTPPEQENPVAEPQFAGNWPPRPFPDISTPWTPSYSPHSPLSSTQHPRHSRHSFSSQQSLGTRQPSQNQQPFSTQPSRKSTARISIGKPSLSRLDSGQNAFDCPSRADCRSAMRRRLATIGRPSLTRLDLGCCQDNSSFGGSDIAPNGAADRYEDLSPNAEHCRRGSWAQQIDPFPQDPATGIDFGTDSPEQNGRCECRMPPAFARYRCTGNLSGLCDCSNCHDNK